MRIDVFGEEAAMGLIDKLGETDFLQTIINICSRMPFVQVKNPINVTIDRPGDKIGRPAKKVT